MNRTAIVIVLVPALVWRWAVENDPDYVARRGRPAFAEQSEESREYWASGFAGEILRGMRAKWLLVESIQARCAPVNGAPEFVDESSAPAARLECCDHSADEESLLLAWGYLDAAYRCTPRRAPRWRLNRFGPRPEAVVAEFSFGRGGT